MAKKYLALLRGINVGGKNIIKMVDLKSCFESMGCTDVTTYIQSGNVIFTSTEKNQDSLCTRIEKTLSKTFGYDSLVVLISKTQLDTIIKEAPKGFGTEPQTYRYDVIYLKKPLTPAKAFPELQIREGVDEASQGKKALYFSRLIERASQSQLSKIIAKPVYKQMTIRNWNTSTKLQTMMNASTSS